MDGKNGTAPNNQIYMDWSTIRTAGHSQIYMDWSTLPTKKDAGVVKIIHSTPLRHRPAPTESPNLSVIRRISEEQILQLAERLAQLSLNC